MHEYINLYLVISIGRRRVSDELINLVAAIVINTSTLVVGGVMTQAEATNLVFTTSNG
jgi:hypothetical protein